MDKNVCECCSSKHISILGRHAGYNHLLCNDCRFEYFMREGGSPSGSLYEKDGDYLDDLAVSGNYRDLLQWQHLIALKFIKSIKKSTPVILDVGCFNGFFVKKLCDLGYEAHGIDFNRTAIEYGGSTYGLGNRIGVKDIDGLNAEKRKFDLITLFDVIEHLESPRQLLLSLRELLVEGGVLILSTPNNRMLWRPLLDYPPHHLSRYHPHTLARFLSTNEFTIVGQFEQMNLFNLVRNFIGTLFRDKRSESLRGGRLGNRRWMNAARTWLNRIRPFVYAVLYPVDRLLHLVGLRYIGQVVICEKIK